MNQDPTTKALVHMIDGAAEISVDSANVYPTEGGPLAFDLYRPGTDRRRAHPAVILVSGLPDPGVVAMLGKPLKDWASYVGWARMIAASGIVAITYLNRSPEDVIALAHHVRAHAEALGIDPTRIGVWACSGNVPMALALVAKEQLACAAFLYGYLLDLDGASDVADASVQYHFAVPAVSLEELSQQMPMLVVRACADTTPGLDVTLLRFVAAARARGLALTLIENQGAPHAFDLVDDSPATRAVIDDVLAFLQRSLVER